jgi:hypothetical protein
MLASGLEEQGPVSNVGKWDGWHGSLEAPRPYGDSESYRIGAEYLADCEVVEDWGCGAGWFSKFRTHGYVGVDGSRSPFATRIADLEEYTSSADGIFMRHVLEHNYRWSEVLRNAVRSFRRKLVLAIFTPWSDGETREIAFVDRVGVPNISFRKDDIVEHLRGLRFELLEISSPETLYGQEHVFLVSRGEGA